MFWYHWLILRRKQWFPHDTHHPIYTELEGTSYYRAQSYFLNISFIFVCIYILFLIIVYFFLILLLWSFLFLFSFLFSFSFSLRRTSVGRILRTTSVHPLFSMRCGGVERTGIFLPPLLPLSLDAANRHNSNSNQCSRKEFCAKFRDCRKVNIYSKYMELEC